MEFVNTIDTDIYVFLINKYIKFYKKEIKNNNFFDGISLENFGSTSDQMELFNTEMEKFKFCDESFRNVENINDKKNKKYIITKNCEKILSSESLLSLLIELYNLENEDKISIYDIILNK